MAAISVIAKQIVLLGKPKNADFAWCEDLKIQVIKLFKQGKTIQELALYFEQTEEAIRSELVRQGIIDQNEKQNHR